MASTITWLALIATGGLVLTGSPAAAAGPAPAATCGTTPTVTAAPATDYDQAFNAYGDTSGAWSGADSTYSVALPGDRELWAFSDTLIGNVNAGGSGQGGSRPSDTPFVNNSFVVTNHGQFQTVIGGTPTAPAANATPTDPDAWYWSGDPTMAGQYLEVP